jgi:tRNA threonylcarbamoyladenosine biosynthesis protein TsaB
MQADSVTRAAAAPLVLAIDTTHEFGSLALARGGEIAGELALHSPSGFGHVLFDEIGRFLADCGVQLREVDCFASAAGPGSFTGVRVGLSCVKGLAEATGKPAIGVSNLRAIASFGSAPLRAAVLDARRGEIYGAVYDCEGNVVAPEVVAKVDTWLQSLPEGNLEFISADFTPLRDALAGTRFKAASVVNAPRELASAIARIAAVLIARGEAHDPAALDANYVRRSDAELFWKE